MRVVSLVEWRYLSVAMLAGLLTCFRRDAVVVVVGDLMRWPAAPVAVTGAMLCFALRWLAIRRGWSLPLPAEEDP